MVIVGLVFLGCLELLFTFFTAAPEEVVARNRSVATFLANVKAFQFRQHGSEVIRQNAIGTTHDWHQHIFLPGS